MSPDPRVEAVAVWLIDEFGQHEAGALCDIWTPRAVRLLAAADAASPQPSLLLKLVTDCQADLSRYLEPGGLSEQDVIRRLLERLDGPQWREAEAEATSPSVVTDMAIRLQRAKEALDAMDAPVTEEEVERAVSVFRTGGLRAVLIDFQTTRIAARAS